MVESIVLRDNRTGHCAPSAIFSDTTIRYSVSIDANANIYLMEAFAQLCYYTASPSAVYLRY